MVWTLATLATHFEFHRLPSPRDGTVLNYRLMLRGLNFTRRMCVYNVCLIISLRPPNLLTLTCRVVQCNVVPCSIWNWSFQLSGSCAQFFFPHLFILIGRIYSCSLLLWMRPGYFYVIHAQGCHRELVHKKWESFCNLQWPFFFSHNLFIDFSF